MYFLFIGRQECLRNLGCQDEQYITNEQLNKYLVHKQNTMVGLTNSKEYIGVRKKIMMVC